MSKPRLLDLFCGAGGATHGYQVAGFHVIGVDLFAQKNYCGDEFFQGDALEILTRLDWGIFDAVHASPPCQGYSTQTADRSKHQRLIGQVRDLLIAGGLPYVIENVEGAAKELRDPVRLCGSSFGMDVRRHRYFETNWPLVAPPCNHAWQTPRFRSLDMKSVRAGRLATVVGVHGHLNYAGERAIRERAMGIDWMTDAELAEAIPPRFTRFVGDQLAGYLRAVREEAC